MKKKENKMYPMGPGGVTNSKSLSEMYYKIEDRTTGSMAASGMSFANKGKVIMTEATYNIKAIKSALKDARDVHVKAIKDAGKAAELVAKTLTEKFISGMGANVTSEEPVLLATSAVSTKQYDDVLAQLALLDGDSVQSGALVCEPTFLIQNAGKVDTSKRYIKITSC